MSFLIHLNKPEMDVTNSDVIEEIKKTNPFCVETENSLLTKILNDVSEEEKTLKTCLKMSGMKSKRLDQEHLKAISRKLDELKSEVAKAEKENFKRYVKERCDIDVFHDCVTTHLLVPPEEEIQTALDQDVGRMLAYLKKRKKLEKMEKMTPPQSKSAVEKKERKRRRMDMNRIMGEITEELNDVNSGIQHIVKVLRSSYDNNAKVAYAQMIVDQFEKIKAKLSALVEKRNELEKELRKYLKDRKTALKTEPNYIDEQCEICIEKEKSWDDSWRATGLCEPMTAEDARNFHARMVRSGGMRGLIDQFKVLLSYEISDPAVALPSLVCSMTDPKRADKLYRLISENNFLKDFRYSLLKKEGIKPPKEIKQDCMECGITVKRCSF